MNTKKLIDRLGPLLGLALFAGLLLSSVPAWSQAGKAPAATTGSEVLAIVEAIEREAAIQRAGEAKFTKLAVKQPVHLMDFLSTGARSKLWWRGVFSAYSVSGDWNPVPDVTHGSLGAESLFSFMQFQRTGASYQVIGQVPKGSVRFIKKLPTTDPPSAFIIVTPTAWIEVLPTDRAADFVVQSINQALTTVTVLWGKVRVKNVSDKLKETRVLTSCQEVDVEREKEPGRVRWVSTDTMDKLIKRTTIPKTLPMDVPSCERVKKEVILEPGEVYVAPPGVLLFPVPVPTPGEKVKEECPCPCPEGQQFNQQTGQCTPCRRGATYNAQTCSCDCPCPTGQVLLPGTGCVPQCPPGFSIDYDMSTAFPYRCPVCTQSSVPLRATGVPPPTGCQTNQTCGPCEDCVRGVCTPKSCERGFILNKQNCQCEPITLTFPQTPLSGLVSDCTSNRDCPQGQMCQGGKCVKRPPVTWRPPQEEDEPEGSAGEEPSSGPTVTVPGFPFGGGFGVGIGVGPGGPGPGGPAPGGPPGRQPQRPVAK
jgi:hypothetical protein